MTELVHRLERQGLAVRVDDPEDGRAALVDITDAGRALLDDRRRDRRERLAELLTALSPEEEATLTLAMHVALPIIRRLIDNATNPGTARPEPRDQRGEIPSRTMAIWVMARIELLERVCARGVGDGGDQQSQQVPLRRWSQADRGDQPAAGPDTPCGRRR